MTMGREALLPGPEWREVVARVEPTLSRRVHPHRQHGGVPARTGVDPVGTVAQQVELAADAVELFLLSYRVMPPFG